MNLTTAKCSQEHGKMTMKADTMEHTSQDSSPENPYFLLTPGPLSTSKSVKQVMLRDWCTWDDDYNGIVQNIRRQLINLAGADDSGDFTSVLMQGSGTFCVESVITTAVPKTGKLLVLANGAYGLRMGKIACQAGVPCEVLYFGETSPPDTAEIEKKLNQDPSITHVAFVHCETTTGMLNPIDAISKVVSSHGKILIIDAMSSFGGIPMDIVELKADYLISSANKCIQGVPGFGFVIARRSEIEQLEGRARSHSLDLYDQWYTMESKGGKWRFTSPTHVVRAFAKALEELQDEGGVNLRFQRYLRNHQTLVAGMSALGFPCLLEACHRSPIITAFHNPEHPEYDFMQFYHKLKSRGFVIYPGKVTDIDTFRVGTIGHIFQNNIEQLIDAVQTSMYWDRSSIKV